MTQELDWLMAIDTPWVPPDSPALHDPVWLDNYKKASELQRQNLATHWVSEFNRQYASCNDDVVRQVIAENAAWLRRIEPYFSTLPFHLDHCCTQDQLLAPFVTTSAPGKKLASLISVLWFGGREARREAATSVYDAYLASVASGGSVFRHYHMLAHELMWDVVEDKDDPLFNKAVTLSVLTAMQFHYMNKSAHPAGNAWLTLAYLVDVKDQLVLNDGTNKLIASIMESTPEDVAIVHFSRILTRLATSRPPGPPGSLGPLQIAEVVTPDGKREPRTLYSVMSQLFPQHTKAFDMGEDLGLDFKDTCAQIATACRRTTGIPAGIHRIEFAA